MSLCIALDVMGGDHGATEIIPAALLSLEKHKRLNLILVGNETRMQEALAEHGARPGERLQLRHAAEVVEMHESPALALRTKKDSSMRVAIELVKDAAAHACVSAGNTGALMATAKYVLKMLPGIDRPAICSMTPGLEKHTHVLDLGANIEPDAEQLFQYAVMGAELTSAVDNIPEPTVGLLNVGAEKIKGNDRVKQADRILSESHLNYVGFVEGGDIYSGRVDVIVCDGFTGNIAIKASEGVGKLFTYHAKTEFGRSLYGKFSALVSMPVLKAIHRKVDPRSYNGASLLGLRGIVVKSHGSADRLSFSTAVSEAVLEVKKNIPERISARLEELLMEGQSL